MMRFCWGEDPISAGLRAGGTWRSWRTSCSLMHLEEFALRPVNRLSGGEAQKVMIARALAQEPESFYWTSP